MPRSPSRDFAERFNHRDGTRLRYFRDWNRHEQWKIWLSRLAVLAVLGWAAASFLTARFNTQANHGPVIAAHARWENECEVCHRDVQGKSTLDAHSRWHEFSDSCIRCHAAPAHSDMLKAEDQSRDCSSCHHDHNGRDFSLVRLSDDHCVRCHENLKENMVGEPHYENRITGFATDHPPLKSLQKRTSTLKFSHVQHMTPGMVLAPGAANARLKDGEPEQLDCASCHTLDTTPGTRAAGQYFQPIKFEQHCARCHPTEVPPTVRSDFNITNTLKLPHGKAGAELQTILKEQFAADLLARHAPVHPTLVTETMRAASLLSLEADRDAATKQATDWLARIGCAKCHDGAKTDDNGLVIAKTAIPTIWMKDAKFDHTAHRAMDCRGCHPGPYEKITGTSRPTEREAPNFLSDSLQSCQSCHSPQGQVRHACTDCHGFHNGDHGLQGRGDPVFAPAKRLDLRDFLKGH